MICVFPEILLPQRFTTFMSCGRQPVPVAEASQQFQWAQLKHTAPFKKCYPLPRLVFVSSAKSPINSQKCPLAKGTMYLPPSWEFGGGDEEGRGGEESQITLNG